MKYSVAYISDQRFYWDGSVWYTSNGFPLQEIIDASSHADLVSWTFFGRITTVDQPPVFALPIPLIPSVKINVVGPKNSNPGLLGYISALGSYLRCLKKCFREHDVLWIKANFVAGWISIPFMMSSKKLCITHQVGDPAKIQVGPKSLMPAIRSIATFLTRAVHKQSSINVFVSSALARSYCAPNRPLWIVNESRVRATQMIDEAQLNTTVNCPIQILYVGRLSPEKGIETLIESVSTLQFPFCLSIVGSGNQEKSLKLLAQNLGIADRVLFVGSIKWGESLFSRMRAADILVLPSYTEGLPLVVIEAMSQGLPVIASDVGGIPELIKNHDTGLLVPAGNHLALSTAIKLLVKDPGLRMKIKTRALQVSTANTLDNQLGAMFDRLSQRVGTQMRER